jgi:hypothetical protein
MKGWIFEAVGGHEAKQFAVGGVEHVLVGETDREHAIRAEQ